MLLLYIALFDIIVFFVFVLIIESKLLKKRVEKGIEYRLELSCDELFCDEYLYLEQIIVNKTGKIIPYLKVETLLPEGLSFVLADEGDGKDELKNSVDSIWTIKPDSQIKRRWRLQANKRGYYKTSEIITYIIYGNSMGFRSMSKKLEFSQECDRTVTVLPTSDEWLTQIALSDAFMGDRTVENGLVNDPMTVRGIRDYESYDPLNTVDWKQSARLGKLMVRKYESQKNDCYNIVLNLQSLLIEPNPPSIASPRYTERCISMCCSLLDSAMLRNIPVRLIANTDPENAYGGSCLHEDEKGKKIFCSNEYSGKDSAIEAYRMLARMPMSMSVTVEELIDDIAKQPQFYSNGGNIIMVSTFINQRMIDLHKAMKKQGINIVFFIFTSNNNAIEIPNDLNVYFKSTLSLGGTWYGY